MEGFIKNSPNILCTKNIYQLLLQDLEYADKIYNFDIFELQAELIKRLKAGEVILGDGSYTVTLEKRGYVLANAWTPESSVEHPEAVRQLALEFARAGADVTQTYTFFSDDKRLKEWYGDKVPSVSSSTAF